MQHSEALVKVCQEIAKEGLTPGVGLLRARAPFKVSIAQAIEAIKAFKQGRPGVSDATPDNGEQVSLESRVAVLEQRVSELENLLQHALTTRSG